MSIYRTFSLCAALSIMAASSAMAQPAPQQPSHPTPAPSMFGMVGPKSPELGANGSVTFRLQAPDAKAVSLTGNWQPGLRQGVMAAPVPMTKGDNGIWELTVPGLKPEMWTYNFVVDGVRILDPSNVNVMRDGTRFLSLLTIPGTGSELYTVNNVAHGTVHQIWYPSPTLNMAARRMYVYTPAGYENGAEHYPVFYLLHGGGGDEDAWDNLGRAREIFDNLIAAGKAKPMIVVMTNGNWNQSAAPGVTEQADSGIASMANLTSADLAKMMNDMLKFDDSLVMDVIPFVDKTYRTIPDRDHRALAGLSMGGGQTLDTGLHHLDTFSYIASFSGGLMLLPGTIKPGTSPLAMVTTPGRGSEIDVSALSADFPGFDASANQKLHLLYITCGQKDGLLTSNQQFMDWLTSKGVNYKSLVLPGYAHEWPFWRISLSNLLPQLF